jgi:hypothetical protein
MAVKLRSALERTMGIIVQSSFARRRCDWPLAMGHMKHSYHGYPPAHTWYIYYLFDIIYIFYNESRPTHEF